MGLPYVSPGSRPGVLFVTGSVGSPPETHPPRRDSTEARSFPQWETPQSGVRRGSHDLHEGTGEVVGGTPDRTVRTDDQGRPTVTRGRLAQRRRWDVPLAGPVNSRGHRSDTGVLVPDPVSSPTWRSWVCSAGGRGSVHTGLEAGLESDVVYRERRRGEERNRWGWYQGVRNGANHGSREEDPTRRTSGTSSPENRWTRDVSVGGGRGVSTAGTTPTPVEAPVWGAPVSDRPRSPQPLPTSPPPTTQSGRSDPDPLGCRPKHPTDQRRVSLSQSPRQPPLKDQSPSHRPPGYRSSPIQ